MVTKFISNHKKLVLTALFAAVMCSFTFAQNTAATDAASSMTTSVNNIVDFFSKGWVKGIACIMLIGECLGLLFAGGQNPQIFKKFLPFIIGTVLFMCAGKIITMVFKDFGSSTFSNDLAATFYLLPEQTSPDGNGIEYILPEETFNA